MANRKATPTFFAQPAELTRVFAGLGIVATVLNNLSAFGSIAAVILIAAAVVWYIQKNLKNSKQSDVLASVSEAIDRHSNALISYYHQSCREDLFGNKDLSRWHEKVDTFLRHQAVPNISDFASWRPSTTGQMAAAMVHEATIEKIAAHKRANPLAQIEASTLNPLEYERHCAELLRECGWAVKMTPATGDGGADFIAEKHDWRIVVQCKRYAQPVGNKAVQEVTSALLLYNGNVAFVVAPMGFTRQAQREAHAQRVELLHHSALPIFAERLAI